MNKKRAIALVLSAIICISLFAACQNTGSDAAVSVLLEDSATVIPEADFVQKDNGKPLGYQLDKPEIGEEIAVVTVKDMGEFKIRFFPDEAPKTVYNFKKQAKNGYYNGLTFHRVVKNFVIQAGDDGTGGKSIWYNDSASSAASSTEAAAPTRGEFGDEFNANLVNIDFSVAMANSGANTNASQFFVNNTEKSAPNWQYYEQSFEQYKQAPHNFDKTLDMDKVTEEYRTLYDQNGGNPHLDGFYSTNSTGHTVFGQVFEGMDVIQKISEIEVDSKYYKPIQDCIIEKIEIVNY